MSSRRGEHQIRRRRNRFTREQGESDAGITVGAEYRCSGMPVTDCDHTASSETLRQATGNYVRRRRSRRRKGLVGDAALSWLALRFASQTLQDFLRAVRDANIDRQFRGWGLCEQLPAESCVATHHSMREASTGWAAARHGARRTLDCPNPIDTTVPPSRSAAVVVGGLATRLGLGAHSGGIDPAPPADKLVAGRSC